MCCSSLVTDDVMLLLLMLCCWRCSFDLLFKCRKTTTGFCSISYAVCCCCCRRCFCSVVVIVFSFSFCCCLQPNQPNERPSTSRLFLFHFILGWCFARSLSLSVLCLFFSSALCSVQNKHTYLCIQLNGRINKRIVGENGRSVGRTVNQTHERADETTDCPSGRRQMGKTFSDSLSSSLSTVWRSIGLLLHSVLGRSFGLG